MRKREWSVKNKCHSFRGKRGKKGGSQYPRHTMNLFEGTHLSMKKKIVNRIGDLSSGSNHQGAILHSKYIIGLLNKFVGKSYKDFRRVYDNKIKNIKKYNVYWFKLEDYLNKEPKTCYFKQEFYIDENGLIQRCKLISRYNIGGPRLTKSQIRYNERVEIPNLGVCRTDSRCRVIKDWCEQYNDDEFPIYHNKRYPILLGTFWVVINKKVLRLPVYTYNSDYSIEYFNYRESFYDYKTRKYVTIPFEEYISKYDKIIQKNIKQIVKDWIPVYYKISSKCYGQDYWITVENPDIAEYNQEIVKYTKIIENNPESKDEMEAKISEIRERINNLPPMATINMGYGKFYLFVKREDYELALNKK